jgi:hypothetical protein
VSRSAAGVSDLTAGFRLQVFDDDLQGAMIVAVGVPIGRSSTSPPIGPGDFRADFMSYLSKTFDSVPVLLAMGMGMRLRGQVVCGRDVGPAIAVEVGDGDADGVRAAGTASAGARCVPSRQRERGMA